MRELIRRLLYVVRQRRRDAELAEELEFHRQSKQRELEGDGVDPADALLTSRRIMGNDITARQYSRDVWIWPAVQNVIQDVRFAARLLRRERGFALTAMLVLGLGIGVNNMLVTIIYAHTLRGLPIDRADRVLHISTFDDRVSDRPLSDPDYEDVQRAASFAGMAAFFNSPVVVGDIGRAPDRFEGGYVSANAFRVIGIEPLIGRAFEKADDRAGAEPVVMLGADAWRSRYGEDRSILGRSILVNGSPATVIAIVPDRAGFPSTAQVWLPLSLMPGAESQRRDARALRVFGRLRDDVDPATARAEIESIIGRIARDNPDTSKALRASVTPINERFLGHPTDPAWLAFITAGFLVLLVSCANVANLLLARGVSRAREMAIRGSLGASRLRVIGQLLIEGVVLAMLGAATGLAISIGGVRIFRSAIPDNVLPYWTDYTMDLRIFGALVAVSFASILVFGLMPALQASRIDVNRILKDGGRTSPRSTRRLTTAFLTMQFALTVLLLAQVVENGLENSTPLPSEAAISSPQLLTASISLPTDQYRTLQQRGDFYRRLNERLAAVSEIAACTTASVLPVRGTLQQRLELEGRPTIAGEDAPRVGSVAIAPRYFETLSVPIERGREFGEEDGLAGREHAIVNRHFADVHFPGVDPIGRLIRLTPANAPPSSPPAAWLSIIGVSQNVRQRPARDPEPIVYLPIGVTPPVNAALLVRSASQHESIAGQLREQILAIDPHVPIYRVMSMPRAIEEAEWNGRVASRLILTLTLLTLAFSVVGLYAVTAHTVSLRSHEIGIRIALGAAPRQLRQLILRRALFQVAIGLVLGIMGTMAWEAAFFTGQIDLKFTDPMVLVPIASLLAAVTYAACVIPTRRAVRLDPVSALRAE